MKTKLFAANFIPILAQASSGDLAGGASKALGIVMLIGFIFGNHLRSRRRLRHPAR